MCFNLNTTWKFAWHGSFRTRGRCAAERYQITENLCFPASVWLEMWTPFQLPMATHGYDFIARVQQSIHCYGFGRGEIFR